MCHVGLPLIYAPGSKCFAQFYTPLTDRQQLWVPMHAKTALKPDVVLQKQKLCLQSHAQINLLNSNSRAIKRHLEQERQTQKFDNRGWVEKDRLAKNKQRAALRYLWCLQLPW